MKYVFFICVAISCAFPLSRTHSLSLLSPPSLLLSLPPPPPPPLSPTHPFLSLSPSPPLSLSPSPAPNPSSLLLSPPPPLSLSLSHTLACVGSPCRLSDELLHYILKTVVRESCLLITKCQTVARDDFQKLLSTVPV